MDWTWLLHGIILWILTGILGGIGVAILRKYRADWASPVMYGLGAAALIFAILVAYKAEVVLSAIPKPPLPTTTDNIESNIRMWCDYWEFGVQRQEDSNFYFKDAIGLPGSHVQLLVGRPKSHDRYIQIEASLPVSAEEATALSKFSNKDLRRTREEITLEMSRGRAGFMLVPPNPEAPKIEGIILVKLVPISAGLNQDVFIDDVNAVEQATVQASAALSVLIGRP